MDRAVVILRHLAELDGQQPQHHLDVFPVEADAAAPKGAVGTDFDDEDGSDKDSGDSGEVAYAGEVDVQVTYNPETKDYELGAVPHQLSFDQGFFYTIRAIEMLKEKSPSKVICIGIGGPPGAGKSTFAHKLKDTLDTLIIPISNFFKTDKVVDSNAEDPELLQTDNLKDVLRQLRTVKTARLPNKNTDLVVPPSNIVVIEGSYALHKDITSLLDITIMLDGGIHSNLLKKILRDTSTLKRSAQKDHLTQVTSILFPMFKVFRESMKSDINGAKIRIHSLYNPMTSMLEPVYVVKARYQVVRNAFESRLAELPNFKPTSGQKKTCADMFFYPPKFADMPTNRNDIIRIRRQDGVFTIYFYNEVVDKQVNMRPVINFEISVKTISGLLSLGYQLGAILNRTSETLYSASGIVITKDSIKELEQEYIQIKGKNRVDVVQLSKRLGVAEHHITQSFLDLYKNNLRRQRAKVPPNTAAGAANAK